MWSTFGITEGSPKLPQTRIIISDASKLGHTRWEPKSSIIEHPKEYISTAVPLLAFRNISGAMYGNVPGPFPCDVTVASEAFLIPCHRVSLHLDPWSPINIT